MLLPKLGEAQIGRRVALRRPRGPLINEDGNLRVREGSNGVFFRALRVVFVGRPLLEVQHKAVAGGFVDKHPAFR